MIKIRDGKFSDGNRGQQMVQFTIWALIARYLCRELTLQIACFGWKTRF
jgi:hypothetical protein